jgi:UDP-N-acetylmuramoylalanine--D-glutamate ligase
MDLAGRSVLVLGLGVSGRSAAIFCAARGAHVVAADERPAEMLTGLSELHPGIELCTGGALPDPANFDLVVPSPGVPRERYAARAERVWGDIELAGRALQIPIVAVTGTNGKTTTVRLIEAMLRSAGLRARAAGNVGRPALSLVGEDLDVAVLEVSSFQLESVECFRPHVATILNLSPDHLDRHGSFEAYTATKAKILEHQRADDCAVLSFDDPTVRELEASARARVVPFSRTLALARGAYLDAGALVLRDETGSLRLGLDDLALHGAHNLENTLAAMASVWVSQANPTRALRALRDFPNLPHRCETVTTFLGATYVNDSKATNVGAAIRALESFDAPLIWIAGGRNKGLDFDALAATAASRIRMALLIGEAARELESALAGRVETQHCDSLAEAVSTAAGVARAGDVVLLSPACASFDQFESFEDRGEQFRAAVEALSKGGSAS